MDVRRVALAMKKAREAGLDAKLKMKAGMRSMEIEAARRYANLCTISCGGCDVVRGWRSRGLGRTKDHDIHSNTKRALRVLLRDMKLFSGIDEMTSKKSDNKTIPNRGKGS